MRSGVASDNLSADEDHPHDVTDHSYRRRDAVREDALPEIREELPDDSGDEYESVFEADTAICHTPCKLAPSDGEPTSVGTNDPEDGDEDEREVDTLDIQQCV